MIKNAARFLVMMLLCVLLMQIVSADIILPGQKGVSYCFKIDNIDDFSGYDFVLADNYELPNHYASVQPSLIRQDECVHFYKLSRPTIYAVKKEFVNESLFENSQYHHEELIEHVTGLFNESKLMPSGFTLSYGSTAPENDPLKGMVDVFMIQDVVDNRLYVTKYQVIYTYDNGENETKEYVNQSVIPEPSRKPLYPMWLPGLLLAILATIVIEALIIWMFLRGKPWTPLIFSAMVNTITVPAANFAVLLVSSHKITDMYPFWIVLIELSVFLAEFAAIKHFLKTSFLKAALMSFLANLISFIIGVIFLFFNAHFML